MSDGAHTTSAGGAAAQAPVDLAGSADSVFGRNGSDLMVRNDIARTHDHYRTPSQPVLLPGNAVILPSALRNRIIPNRNVPFCGVAQQAQ